ncbi:MAG: T9SS type A sorting domain-containing protein [Bacteroidota bacterium]
MKKAILFWAMAMCWGLMSAQTETYISETGGVDDPVIYVASEYQYTPCDINGSSNAFENGKSFTHSLGRIVANDITVPSGENLTIEKIVVNVFIGAADSGVNASFADIYIYNDNNGEPGAVDGGEFGVIPSSQLVVGSNFGFDVWQVELDIPDYTVYSNNSPVTFWIGISMEATDGSNLFWENSTNAVIGYGEAYDDGVGNSFEVDPTLEGVYEVVADCEPRLGIDDPFSQRLKIYPNPVVDGLFYIETSLPDTKRVIIHDLNGKEWKDVDITNEPVDVSILGSGIYFITIIENDNVDTRKLIVR